MKLLITWDWITLEIGHWFFSIYPKPTRWAIDWHREAPCCKFWIVLGPFEINRTWADSDDYPFNFEGEDDEDLH
jgi:hypothetical protein